MDKLMDSPWFLRFTALFLAIILFVSVKTGEGTKDGGAVGEDLGQIRDLPVEVYYDNENLVVTGVPETVNITIEGPMNLVQTTKLLKDFIIKVDLRSLPLGKHQVRIEHENISGKLQVRIDPATIDVVIEEKITQSFRVDPEFNERLLAEDFNVVSMDVIPSTIEVTGAKSVIEAISFVKASATGDQGINKSFEHQARVRVLDRDLNKLNVVIVPERVTVKVEIAEYNKEVPIVIKARGVPAEGINVDSLTAEEPLIILSGPRKTLDAIEEFSVDVDVSEITGPGTMEVSLKKPKGISAMSMEKLRIKVEVSVIETETEEDVASSDMPEETVIPSGKMMFENIQVMVKGLDNKYKSTFLKPENGLLTLTVEAEQDVIDALKKSDFIVYVDAAGTTGEGERILSVSVEGPPDIHWKLSDEEVTMQIELA